MRDRPCVLEDQILEATRSDGLTAELSRHLATCRSCSEAVSIDNLLQSEARRAPELSRLPDPGRIWIQARQQRLLQAADRATRPIRAAEKIALAVLAGAVPDPARTPSDLMAATGAIALAREITEITADRMIEART